MPLIDELPTVKAPLLLRVQVGLDITIGTGRTFKVSLSIEIKQAEPKVATRNEKPVRETRNSKKTKKTFNSKRNSKNSKTSKQSKSLKESKQFKGLEQQQQKKKKTSSGGPFSGPKAQRFKDLLEKELKSKRS